MTLQPQLTHHPDPRPRRPDLPLEQYARFCGPAVLASVLGISPRMAAEWLRRSGAQRRGGGTDPAVFGLLLGTRELFIARWHDRPMSQATAWPTVRQFLTVHQGETDDFVLRSRCHVVHARAGRIICDTSANGTLCRVYSVFPAFLGARPRCPWTTVEPRAARLSPFVKWRAAA